jgi:hypothetical protein
VNEVVIGIKDKDKFNGSEPKDDLANFGAYITNPTLPFLIETLFGPANAPAPTNFPRGDLVAAFGTGVTNANQIPSGANAGATVAEMLRLNTAVAVTSAAGQVNRVAGTKAQLGAAPCFVTDATAGATIKKFDPTTAGAACDPAGFPNGRRPGDDVVDITLRVAMGFLDNIATQAGAGGAALGDLVPQRADQFQPGVAPTFPYLNKPVIDTTDGAN